MGRRPRSGQGQRSQPVLRAMSVVRPTVSLSHGRYPLRNCKLGQAHIAIIVRQTVSVSVLTRTPPTVRSDMCQTRRGRARAR